MTQNMIIVGAIAGSFGVHGDVRIKSFCAVPEDIATYGTLMSEDGKRSFDIALTRSIKNGFSARVDGVETKEEADALRGVTLHASRDALPSLPDDEFYHADLIGLEVCDTGGTVLGKITDVLNHGAGDLLEVSGPTLKASVLVPFTRAHAPTVDLSARRIIVDPPEGLFE